mmetsp:Transcript_84819/g.134018  ORF Transcript_84819/g.134018 Transcript_84819/m.134018 type:complete len:281 (+) Transcript_84819:55-897(+)|eukprot:CAMPEP_0169092640 /NCGR_PEP_ID=MMETSP1015-20121227/17013_1 /TAXON_ID=342587 /ORGANISM="Karlodinium micrum, Strain CCMP2283" /LENGTH=280 /DNA_ID=CAMNT_0009153231 /DNA_START=48 /DNA_END=890 /DNA_ORIENTATION=-
MVAMAERKYQWREIRRGDAIPEGAVVGGHTATDGVVFVALSEDGDCGKLNLDKCGFANDIWCPSNSSPLQEGWILVKTGSAVAAWRTISKGDRLPESAVFAGRRFGDDEGPMFIARIGNESGKLLLDEQGLVREIQSHHKGSKSSGEVLLFDPVLLPPLRFLSLACDEKDNMPCKSASWQNGDIWRARWMWNDVGIPAMLVPGPLRSLHRGLGPQLNPLRWSKWQDLHLTIYELEAYRGTPQMSRPVRLEISTGVQDAYDSLEDALTLMSRILRGCFIDK